MELHDALIALLLSMDQMVGSRLLIVLEELQKKRLISLFS